MRIIDYPIMPRPQRRDPTTVPVEFIDTPAGLVTLVEALKGASAVAVDTETHSGSSNSQGIWTAARVISLATRHGAPGPDAAYRCFTVDVRNIPSPEMAKVMSTIDEAHGWNADFDEDVLAIYGAPVRRWRDGKFDESLYFAGMPGRGWYLGLAEAARRYLNWEVVGKGTIQTSFDALTDLNQDQIDYAGYDATLTLWLSEIFTVMLERDHLTNIAALEQGQRPFLAMMMANGIPFNKPGWETYLRSLDEKLKECKLRIGEIVGLTSQGELVVNIDSDPLLKDAFNRLETAIVQTRLGRLFEPSDKVDAAMIKELKAAGSLLAVEVLQWRKLSKEITTYGDDFLKFWVDGRIRSRYKQTLTATGRLAADKPNPQNLPGASKWATEAAPGRVLIASDYSQAELRDLAAMAEEIVMLTAFRDGKDLHDETAKEIFGVDLPALKKVDPEKAKKMRTQVKGVGFGIPYGMQARALARKLTNDGAETSVSEASDFINKIMKSRPAMAAWLNERDGFVKAFAKDPGPVDWEASFRLLELWQKFENARRAFKKKNKRFPSAEELVEAVTPRQMSLFEAEMTDEERAALVAEADWAFRYDAPVVLRPPTIEADGTKIYDPVAWESRTTAGRRKIFAIVMDSGYQRSDDDTGGGGKKSDMFNGLVTSAMLVIALSDKASYLDKAGNEQRGAAVIRDEWAAANGMKLPVGINRCIQLDGEDNRAYRARAREFQNEESVKCVNLFKGPNRAKKTELVRHACKVMGPDAANFLLSKALEDCIGRLGPAFRNHPIQGGVADTTARAFELLYSLCEEYPDLIWVQSVHDSIIGECDEANAVEIAIRQKILMEQAQSELYPTVPSKVDTEIRRHLGEENGIISEVTTEMCEEFLAAQLVGV